MRDRDGPVITARTAGFLCCRQRTCASNHFVGPPHESTASCGRCAETSDAILPVGDAGGQKPRATGGGANQFTGIRHQHPSVQLLKVKRLWNKYKLKEGGRSAPGQRHRRAATVAAQPPPGGPEPYGFQTSHLTLKPGKLFPSVLTGTGVSAAERAGAFLLQSVGLTVGRGALPTGLQSLQPP